MAIITGGLQSEFGPARHAHRAVQLEIRSYAPPASDLDYAVDIAFLTGHELGPEPPPLGVSAGMVGRVQRRFIVWHRLPEGLTEVTDVRHWFIDMLPQTESLVREHLPRKSKAYPVTQLADEVAGLRVHLQTLNT